MILATRFTFIVERSLKNIYFHSKIAWPPATSYLVTIKTDHHWTWLKMCPRDKRTDTENVRPGADVLLSRRLPPPPRHVHPWPEVIDTEQPFIETTSPFTSKLLFRLQEEKLTGRSSRVQTMLIKLHVPWMT